MSAELEFLDNQNMILNMENRALKQHLDSVSREQHIKQCEYFRLFLIPKTNISHCYKKTI